MRIAECWRLVARWLGGRESAVLLSIVVVVSATWALISIAGEVIEGNTLAIDQKIVRSIRGAEDVSVPVGPSWLTDAGRDVTALGSYSVVLLLVSLLTGFLLLVNRYQMTLFLVAASVGGIVFSRILKQTFNRPRPEIVPHFVDVSTSSFPSGHAMLSAAVYLSLATLLATTTSRRRLKIYIVGVGILISLLVGVSRVYLGVHYPTDVLAGWCAGTTWALLCWLSYRWLSRRFSIE